MLIHHRVVKVKQSLQISKIIYIYMYILEEFNTKNFKNLRNYI